MCLTLLIIFVLISWKFGEIDRRADQHSTRSQRTPAYPACSDENDPNENEWHGEPLSNAKFSHSTDKLPQETRFHHHWRRYWSMRLSTSALLIPLKCPANISRGDCEPACETAKDVNYVQSDQVCDSSFWSVPPTNSSCDKFLVKAIFGIRWRIYFGFSCIFTWLHRDF